MAGPRTVNARDRLLIAGADLLSNAAGGDVSTREICERAGVQAPTLYHHFGSKQALLDEVVSHGFRQFLADRREQPGEPADPIVAVREAWDTHVRFGVENPAFYAHIYARHEPGQRCGVVTEVESMILATLEPAAAQGRLAIPAAAAAAEILAASTGVVLTLIGSGSGEVDWALSARVRNAILDAVTVSAPPSASGVPTVTTAAVTLAAKLDDAGPLLRPEESALLRVWLDRLSAAAL